jgi:signal transduction histidine kinase
VKLVHQINLAFGLMLLLVMSVTAVVIHYVLLDHLIGVQKADMKTIGRSVSATYQIKSLEPPSDSAQLQAVIAPYAGVQAVVADNEGHIVSETLPQVFLKQQESLPALTAPALSVAARSAEAPLIAGQAWSGTLNDYIVDVSPIPQGTLTLMTPMSKIRTVERALMYRLSIIFAAGGVLILLLSLTITRKLIKPLMSLKAELEKVKERKFADVRKVRAGGEIGAVAQTVYDMSEELHRYSEAQKHFFQNASHELKTPLMSISGYAEGIRDGIIEGEGVGRGLDIIMRESVRLKKLVSEMTLLAKLDSEENIYHVSEVSLKELLTETLERLNPVLAGNGIEVCVQYNGQEELLVLADKDKLLQALLNVGSNAARYAKSRITIYAGVAKGRVFIQMADDGDGISEELLPYLFHRFVKGRDGESGLGLAISRAIVERCGGYISAGNRPEGGAEVTLTLPAAA